MSNFRNPFAGFGRSSRAPLSNPNQDQSTTHSSNTSSTSTSFEAPPSIQAHLTTDSSSTSSIADLNRQVTNAINTQTSDAERYARRMSELEKEIAGYNVRLQEIKNLPRAQKQNFRNEALDILRKKKNATSVKNNLVKPMTPNTSTMIPDKPKQSPERRQNTSSNASSSKGKGIRDLFPNNPSNDTTSSISSTSSITSSSKSRINSSNSPYIEIDKIDNSSMQDLATYLRNTPERANTDFIVNTVIPNIIKYKQQLSGRDRTSKVTDTQKRILFLFTQNKKELVNQLGMYINLAVDKNGQRTDINKTVTEIRNIIYKRQHKP